MRAGQREDLGHELRAPKKCNRSETDESAARSNLKETEKHDSRMRDDNTLKIKTPQIFDWI